MAIVAVFEGPKITEELYEEANRRHSGGKSRLESPSDWPVPGLLVHVAGQGKNGFRVVDVWESEDAFRRFGDIVMSIIQELGLDIQPDIYPAHTVVTA